jgi:sigma-54 dependent transcriptional regulator, acetoin dehydrogenase operon transcriptional activator AcoR
MQRRARHARHTGVGRRRRVRDLKAVQVARDYLLSEGRLPDHLARAVRTPVLQSWHRSVLGGARPDAALMYRGESHVTTALRLAAEPVLGQLAERLRGLQAGVLLADSEANVVQRWVADTSIRPLLDRINSDAGFNIAEDLVGTNGVGSVIEHGGPLQISGPEHLATALHVFTCVGVPIHHPITRRLEGVITMSCRANAANPLLTPLMTSTAQEIEHRILDQASVVERQLLEEYLIAVGARRGPIAAVGADILMAGPKVTELLEGIDRALLWEYVRAVATGSRGDGADYGLSPERFRIARCQPIERDGAVIGALVEFEVPRGETREPAAVVPAPRSAVSLPGKSAALAQTVSLATRLGAKQVPILIEGESGVGKLALARAVLAAAEIDPLAVTTVDAASGWTGGPTRFVSVLLREIEMRPTALVLRHLEALTAESAAACASILDEVIAADWAPRVIATLTTSPQQPAQPWLRRLIDTVGVGRVTLPPLRDRRDDIGPAAVALLARHRGDKTLVLSGAALRCLVRAPWPGNMRQLDACVRGLVSTTVGAEIRADHLPIELQSTAQKRQLTAIEELELNAILAALRRHNGNKVAAAQSIGVSRSTLYRKLQSYHLDPDKQYY